MSEEVVFNKVRPLSDRIIVQRKKREEQTPGGIIIPDTASEERGAWEGVAVAVGPGRIDRGALVEPRVKKGDKVIVGKYSGTEVTIDGKQYVIVREDDLHGVIEG